MPRRPSVHDANARTRRIGGPDQGLVNGATCRTWSARRMIEGHLQFAPWFARTRSERNVARTAVVAWDLGATKTPRFSTITSIRPATTRLGAEVRLRCVRRWARHQQTG